MINPMLNQLQRKTSVNNNIANVIGLLRGSNPDVIFNNMIRTNPQFASFVNENKGKTVEQIANDYGLDISTIKQFIK